VRTSLVALTALSAFVALSALTTLGCSGSRGRGSREQEMSLPGIDTEDLTSREHAAWWRLVNELYAPCPEQAVTLAACVRESRACAACKPGAELLVSRVRAGFVGEDARRAFEARFTRERLPIDSAGSPSKGAEDAPVTVVVWSDFECPHCRLAMPLLEAAFEKQSPKVRLVHKFYPLPAHPHAEPAARAAIAALNQGRYWEMERLLFNNQRALEAADITRYARSLDLDMTRFEADLVSPETSAHLERDRAAGKAAKIAGTPHIVVNGRRFELGLFRLEEDLGPWIELDVALAAERVTKP
jgi:predicted DsbA family dithiol-disulfide isomerase